MIVKFSKNEFNLLKNDFFQGKKYFKELIIKNETIEFDEDLADEIIDWAGEKQQIIGYDEHYELTKHGKILESIIDKLNH